MSKALSIDLRERVIAAVEAGRSCGQAAERFSGGIATAIRWHARFRQEREIAPKPLRGDRCSHRVEAHAALIQQTSEARPQGYRRELRDTLREQGISKSRLDRFSARHGITRKNGISTLPNSAGLT